MRLRSAAILIYEGKLLVLHRLRKGEEYYTFPGGGVDEGEDLETAALRELKEETTVIGKMKKRLYHSIYNNPHSGKVDQQFFLCEYVSGEPKAGDGEEYQNMTEENSYEPMWINLDILPGMTLYPLEVRDALIHDLQNDFADAPRDLDLADSR